MSDVINMVYCHKQPFQLDHIINHSDYTFKTTLKSDLLPLALLHSNGFNVPLTFSIDEIEAIIDTDTMSLYKLIDKDEKIIGMLSCELKNNKCHISNLVIDPKKQSSGLGKLLIKKFLNQLVTQHNITKFVLNVLRSNNKAYHLYTSLGFNQNLSNTPLQ
ncbi:GNAT family N-acetyltransferase [Thiotrichales bacterium 19S3-7]|nr:GNAT family N-acetyltransferase [Thiotrichales bacterium 19S3-7]MCF6802930.1 GNAT family N-acetyltransferase [Thiotrichales bacterium 19S3-11]